MFTHISSNTSQAAHFLKLGIAVAIPTETVYGLAANIYDEKAIRSIFELKERPLNNPLIVHIHSFEQLNEIAKNIPESAFKLANQFWPGPLTLVLDKTNEIPDVITANKTTVGVRMPNHPVALELLQSLPFPLAAPSANPFMRISPTNPERVFEYFEDKIPFILDGGECTNGIESTILGFVEEQPIIYRLGAISVEDIEDVVGKVTVVNKEKSAPIAPGMLDKHYSPKTQLVLTSDVRGELEKYKEKRVGLLSFHQEVEGFVIEATRILSKKRELNEAAHNLYEYLQELDSEDLEVIIAEKMPNHGLGKSINDRLGRASHK